MAGNDLQGSLDLLFTRDPVRISNLFTRSTMDREIAAGLKTHIEMRIDDNIAAGMSPRDARRDAILRFGNPALMRERVTSVDAVLTLDGIAREAPIPSAVTWTKTP